MIKLFIFLIFFSLQALAQNSVLIDVREKDEVAGGMLKNATWIPLSEVKGEKIATLQKEFKGKTLKVYCRSGMRADKFISLLGLSKAQAQNLGGYEDLKSTLPDQKP